MNTLRGRSFHPIEFIRRESCAYGKFCNTLPVRRAHTLICDGALHIQHSIYVRQFEFFVFIMKQIASIFYNLSFAGQYIILSCRTRFSQVFSCIIELRKKTMR